MSIKNQKIIRFIPFVNLLIIAVQWILFYRHNVIPNKMKRIIGNLLLAAAACILLMIIEIIIDSLFNNKVLEMIINLIVSFADMYIFSSILIYDQEKFYNEN